MNVSLSLPGELKLEAKYAAYWIFRASIWIASDFGVDSSSGSNDSAMLLNFGPTLISSVLNLIDTGRGVSR